MWPSAIDSLTNLGFSNPGILEVPADISTYDAWTLILEESDPPRESGALEFTDIQALVDRTGPGARYLSGTSACVEYSTRTAADYREGNAVGEAVDCWGLSTSWGTQAVLTCEVSENRPAADVASALLEILDRPLSTSCDWNVDLKWSWQLFNPARDPRVEMDVSIPKLRRLAGQIEAIPIRLGLDPHKVLEDACGKKMVGRHVVMPMSGSVGSAVVGYNIAIVWGGDEELVPGVYLYPAVANEAETELSFASERNDRYFAAGRILSEPRDITLEWV